MIGDDFMHFPKHFQDCLKVLTIFHKMFTVFTKIALFSPKLPYFHQKFTTFTKNVHYIFPFFSILLQVMVVGDAQTTPTPGPDPTI